MTNFLQRTITGAIFASSIIISILLNKWLFALLFFVFAIIGLIEIIKLSGLKFNNFEKFVTIFCGTIVYVGLVLFFYDIIDKKVLILIMLLAYIFLVLLILFFINNINKIMSIAFILFAITYIIMPLALLNYFDKIQLFIDSPKHLFLFTFFALIWANDTGAYLVGKAIGKHQLCSKISPAKTWEGFIGAAIITIVASVIIGNIYSFKSVVFWCTYGLLIVFSATVGDLFESSMKRQAGVKDSGNFFKGHGGVLDRLDSVLFATPIILIYLYFFI
ncbi:MAG TPA: phosphatidate cytidylyltransferase [Bacteroidales bacterium]|nr:phosphatidate cytidylyltransferase [Bacteroidales bacterium]